MDRKMSEALDRHITGNYGEDQFKDEPEKKKYNVTFLYRFQIEADHEEDAIRKAFEAVEGMEPTIDVQEVDE